MALVTISQLISLEPSVETIPNVNLTNELNRSEGKLFRLLCQTWWTNYTRLHPEVSGQFDGSLLVAEEWTDIICYYALAYQILPKVNTELSGVYHQKFEDAYKTLVEQGISYDVEGVSHQFIEQEERTNFLRMRK